MDATPWSCAYSQLVRNRRTDEGDARARRCDVARGYMAPAPIDHALHTAGVRIADVHVGPDIGSDHFPLLVEVSLADRAAPRASSAAATARRNSS